MNSKALFHKDYAHCLDYSISVVTAEVDSFSQRRTIERDGILLATLDGAIVQIGHFRANGIEEDQVASVFFTTTGDLNAVFPAQAARNLGWRRLRACFSRLMIVDSLIKLPDYYAPRALLNTPRDCRIAVFAVAASCSSQSCLSIRALRRI